MSIDILFRLSRARLQELLLTNKSAKFSAVLRKKITMKLQDIDKCAPTSDWNVLYWVLGSILMPVALPLAAINVWQRFRAQKYRNQLPGKVINTDDSM